ncbi:MAG: BLUF domain-containing protein [Rubrivivax sp.]
MPGFFILLYVSTAALDGVDAGVAAITRAARLSNARLGITGLLAYDGDTFLQCLEGEQTVLADLLQKLRADPRHRDLEVLAFAPATTTGRHVGWDLGYHVVEDESDSLQRFRGLRGSTAIAAFRTLAADLDVGASDPSTT